MQGKKLPREERTKAKLAISAHRFLNIPWHVSCRELKIGRALYYDLVDELATEDVDKETGENFKRLIRDFISSKKEIVRKFKSDAEKVTGAEKRALLEAASHAENELVNTLMKVGLVPHAQEAGVVVNNAVMIKGPIQAQVEAISKIVDARRAMPGSGSTGGTQGQPVVGEGPA
jgi:hypothetical protein